MDAAPQISFPAAPGARAPDTPGPRAWRPILGVTLGNTLEMYDFQVFGYYAPAIARTFFPRTNEYASLMLALVTFGVGFLVRPLGAIFLGAYTDHRGRRAGLLLTLALMAIGTLSIACLPGYAAIGLAAPVLILLGRLLQGFSAGAELGGVSVYLSEIAPPHRKGFYVSWQSASQQPAVMFVAILGIVLASWLSAKDMASWGWRIPLWIGCALIPFLFVLRRSLVETPDFLNRPRRARTGEIFRTLAANWRIVLLGAMMSTLTTVTYYLATVYTPTFGSSELHLAPLTSMIVILCVAICSLTVLPVSGAISDRVGRRPVILSVAGAALATAYPAMAWLVRAPSFGRLLAVELWFAFLYGAYSGGMGAFLAEIVPRDVRSSAFSLAYSLTAVLGGFTPAICTYLIHVTGNRAMPGAWLSVAAVIGLSAALTLREEASTP